jgi:predicted nucleic acid-binding protein
MDKKILVDTGIIIKSYRRNSVIFKELQSMKKSFAVSVVTAFELLNG